MALKCKWLSVKGLNFSLWGMLKIRILILSEQIIVIHVSGLFVRLSVSDFVFLVALLSCSLMHKWLIRPFMSCAYTWWLARSILMDTYQINTQVWIIHTKHLSNPDMFCHEWPKCAKLDMKSVKYIKELHSKYQAMW